MSEAAPTLEGLLHEALAPIEPPADLGRRLESTLLSITESAVEEARVLGALLDARPPQLGSPRGGRRRRWDSRRGPRRASRAPPSTPACWRLARCPRRGRARTRRSRRAHAANPGRSLALASSRIALRAAVRKAPRAASELRSERLFELSSERLSKGALLAISRPTLHSVWFGTIVNVGDMELFEDKTPTVVASSTRLSDEALMALVTRDDPYAFALLYRRHAPVVLAVATQMCQRRAIAEEVVQEAFLSCWRSRRHYNPVRGSVRAWVLGIARNRAIDVLRQNVASEVSHSGQNPVEEAWRPKSAPTARPGGASTPAKSSPPSGTSHPSRVG